MAIIEMSSSEDLKWIDVTNPTADEMGELSLQYNLNQHTVKDCLQPEHLPKYEFDDEFQVHFLILRFVSHDPGKHISTIQELTNKIAIFFTETIVITIHLFDTPFLNMIAKRTEKKSVSTTDLLSKIIWQALETFDDPANRLSDQVDFYENQVILRKKGVYVTGSLYQIKRQASISHKILMLMLEPINHVHITSGRDASLQDVRDQHLKMQTLYSQILEDVNNLLNISMSFAAQRTNEVMRVLTLFSAFFMPLTFIVGVYGMNFDFMPELRQKWGYPGVLIFMATVTFFIYRWFKKKKWL